MSFKEENLSLENVVAQRTRLPFFVRWMINIFLFMLKSSLLLLGLVIVWISKLFLFAAPYLAWLFHFFYIGGFILIGVLIFGLREVDKGVIIAISILFATGYFGKRSFYGLGEVINKIGDFIMGLASDIKYR
ncbi:hypothetical protein [Clostridium formicaceticum]|uniref:Uncharacterized protein n=1 Tax=Clostridium formicaceticum TaxID=1497 RepID=A0AAC9RPY0_9CLOT|nr:hypothetical protein [Clostridium formicaceticum]AOY74724.1 hypothetical protein BJL90_01400 [Clostridium formicaceticum]ARE89110.1 hypothetical protein CLFO_35160 [Clostridium formicaceticum]